MWRPNIAEMLISRVKISETAAHLLARSLPVEKFPREVKGRRGEKRKETEIERRVYRNRTGPYRDSL